MGDNRIRSAFFITDAEDQANKYRDLDRYKVITLLSRRRFVDTDGGEDAPSEQMLTKRANIRVGSVFRFPLVSQFRRYALSVDVFPTGSPDSRIRLINVHLESYPGSFAYRATQLAELTTMLRYDECHRVVIAGDFNTVEAHDVTLVENAGLEDQWTALYGQDKNFEDSSYARFLKVMSPKRLDRVATKGVQATSMKNLAPGKIEVPIPGGETKMAYWSDHFGLASTLTI